MSTKPTKNKASKKRNKRDKLAEKARWTFANGTTRGITDTANAYRTDLHLTEQEEQILTLIGAYLYRLRLQDWKECKKNAGTGLTDRQKSISKACGARYAYAICQLNNQQYQLQKRNIVAEIKILEKEQKIFDEREEKPQNGSKIILISLPMTGRSQRRRTTTHWVIVISTDATGTRNASRGYGTAGTM